MGAKALRYNIRRDIIKCRALCVLISLGAVVYGPRIIFGAVFLADSCLQARDFC